MADEKRVGGAQEGAPAAPKPGKRPEYKITTEVLGKRGARLPIGMPVPDGSFDKTLEVRPWRFKEERELGEMRDKNKNMSMAQYVSMVLAAMCTRLGPHNLEGMKEPERLAIISQMYLADVFYAYVYLRISAMGNVLGCKISCPRCGNDFTYPADLETIETRCAETAAEASWEFKLKRPITIRGKEVGGFVLGPMLWNAMEMAGAAQSGRMNMGAAKGSVIIGSIVEVDGHGPMRVTDTELDDMVKMDIERLAKSIDDKTLGPDMSVDDKCPRCGGTFHMPIDWSYDNFFSDSSD